MDPMTLCNRFIDRVLDGIRALLTVRLFEQIEMGINLLAKIFAPICALAGGLILIILAIKMDSLMLFLAAFGWIFLVVLVYYIGSKLQNTCQTTIRNNPISIASQELIDTTIAVYCVLALTSFIGGFYASIKLSEPYFLLAGVTVGALMIYSLWMLLHPELVSTYVESSSSAGLDAIAYLSLGNKMFLRTSKSLFGVLTTIAAFLLLNSLFKVFGKPEVLLEGGIQGALGFILLISGALAPLVAYMVFIITYMILDVMRSILLMGASSSGSITGNTKNTPEFHSSINSQTEQNDQEKGMEGPSPVVLRNIAIGFVLTLTVIFGIVKGQDYYSEYKEKAEARREEEAKKKAEEEEQRAKDAAEKAAAEAEKQKLQSFLANVRKHIGKPALDLVLEPEVNKVFREIFGPKLPAFENYFSESGDVVEGSGLIVGSGCNKASCDANKALVVVDTKDGKVYSAIVNSGQPLYFGVPEENVSPEVKKWVMSNRK